MIRTPCVARPSFEIPLIGVLTQPDPPHPQPRCPNSRGTPHRCGYPPRRRLRHISPAARGKPAHPLVTTGLTTFVIPQQPPSPPRPPCDPARQAPLALVPPQPSPSSARHRPRSSRQRHIAIFLHAQSAQHKMFGGRRGEQESRLPPGVYVLHSRPQQRQPRQKATSPQTIRNPTTPTPAHMRMSITIAHLAFCFVVSFPRSHPTSRQIRQRPPPVALEHARSLHMTAAFGLPTFLSPFFLSVLQRQQPGSAVASAPPINATLTTFSMYLFIVHLRSLDAGRPIPPTDAHDTETPPVCLLSIQQNQNFAFVSPPVVIFAVL